MPSSLETILASDRLPSLPEVALRVVEVSRRPDPDFNELAAVIRMDPAIAGRVLKTANSALLGMRCRATSIESAVPRLGSTMVRALVLGFSLAEYQERKSISLRPWYQQIWRETLTQAAAAEVLAERQQGGVDPGSWFLAGLLQDVGRLAMLSTCREEYVDQVLDVRDERSQLELEQSYFGFTHVDVGTELCRRWSLEDSMVEAMAVHHAAAHRVFPLRFSSRTMLAAGLITAAHFAEYLEEVSRNLSCSREQIERLLLQVFGFRPNDVCRLLADADSRVGEFAAAFTVDIGQTASREAILAEAQELLARIAVSSQLRLVNAGSRRPAKDRGTAVDDETAGDHWRDAPTGAYTRAYLNHALPLALAQAEKQRIPVGLLLVSLATRARVPSPQAEEAGAVEVRQLSESIRQSIRVCDSVIRFGSDQFLILLQDINVDMLVLLADQIRRRVARDIGSASENDAPVRCDVAAIYYEPVGGKPQTSDCLLQELDRGHREATRQSGGQTVIRAMENGRAVTVAWQVPQTVGIPLADGAAALV